MRNTSDMNSVHSSPTAVRSPFFSRLGDLVVRRRKAVLAGYLASMALFGIFGVQVFGAMQSAGFTDPASDSSRAATLLASTST